MRKIFLFIVFLCFSVIYSNARDIKISVSPSDAKIYVDGNYIGDGVITTQLKKKDGFIAVKFEKEGYVTLEARIFATDKRKAVSYVLRPDPFFSISVASGLVNKYFTISVSKDLYTIDENGKKNTELVWKMLHQVLLNYFDEIQTTDVASGFIQTPWRYDSFPEAGKQLRTRVSIKETNLGGDPMFQVKISSEVANIFAAQKDESFQEIDRIAKDLEPMISEFQARLGK